MANLWIRNQSRTILQKTDCVMYKRTNNTLTIVDGEFYVLGEYKTKGRCIEIIDDIQSLLVRNDKVVYEMPEE